MLNFKHKYTDWVSDEGEEAYGAHYVTEVYEAEADWTNAEKDEDFIELYQTVTADLDGNISISFLMNGNVKLYIENRYYGDYDDCIADWKDENPASDVLQAFADVSIIN